MKLTLSFKLGLGVVVFFSLMLGGMLLWTPVRLRYYASMFQSEDIKKQVAGVDGLLWVGKKGEELLSDEFPGGAKAADLVIEFWKDPERDLVTNVHSSVGKSRLLEAAGNNYATAVKLMLAKVGYFDPKHAATFFELGKSAGGRVNTASSVVYFGNSGTSTSPVLYRRNRTTSSITVTSAITYFENRSDYASAIAYFNIAILLKPDYAEAYNGRGIRKADLGDYDGAVSDYDRAIRLNPKYSEAYNNRGAAKENKKDIDGAIADYTKALEIDPKYLTALDNRIRAYGKKDDLESAIKDYTAKTKISPGNVWTHRNRAYAFFDIGKYDEALRDYENSISMGDPYENQNLYSFFRILLVKLRGGKTDEVRNDAKKYLADWKGDDLDEWSKTVARFFAGELEEDEFIKAADTVAGRTVPQQQCEAYYYAAEFRLARGDKKGAKDLYEKCIATKVDNYTEYRSSRWELKRLDAGIREQENKGRRK